MWLVTYLKQLFHKGFAETVTIINITAEDFRLLVTRITIYEMCIAYRHFVCYIYGVAVQ